ncbi:hypothetical protein [Noviherbaspirillum sp. UKPF54]|uniref:hypothetical protein n=1 Tax=Noviherbaspirillum sp. UKPF54 TaxID=2601898 RepID=UPI00143DB44B|nr:hypothetical protein [Noviherbaspirillum sp. UKPF54]
MSEKTAAIDTLRQPSSSADAWRLMANRAPGVPIRRLTRAQRNEQERLDRYGRFGRR